MCNVNAYSEAKALFGKYDPKVMAANSGAVYQEDKNCFSLVYMGAMVEITYPEGEIRLLEDGAKTAKKPSWELVKNDKVIILQYLMAASGAAPKGNWISFIQLPGGPHHHALFVSEAIEPLAKSYGDRAEDFRELLAEFSGTPIQMGDHGASVPVFPKLPMAVCVRAGDDEFPATANVLFDAVASLHLTTAALWVLGIELSRKLLGTIGQQFSR